MDDQEESERSNRSVEKEIAEIKSDEHCVDDPRETQSTHLDDDPGASDANDEVNELSAQQSSAWIRQQSQMILSLVNYNDDDDQIDATGDDEDLGGAKEVGIENNRIPHTLMEKSESGRLSSMAKKKEASKAEKGIAGEDQMIGAINIAGIEGEIVSENGDHDVENFPENVHCATNESSGSGILIAQPLTPEELKAELHDEMMRDTVEATRIVVEEERPRNTKATIIILIMIIIITTVSVAVATSEGFTRAIPSDEQDSDIGHNANEISFSPTIQSSISPTQSPTAFPTLSESQKELLEYLSEISSDGGIALNQTSSPQYKALLWLSELYPDQYKRGDDLKERYALATLFYSTNGFDWKDNTGWKI